MVAALQVLGLSTVVATAIGCLYFMDSTQEAQGAQPRNAGLLNAVGVLILLLNTLFVIVTAAVVFRAAKREYYAAVTWFTHKVQCLWEGCLAVMSWRPCWSVKTLTELIARVRGRHDSPAAGQSRLQIPLQNGRMRRASLTFLIEPESQ